jgi:hypothetical protein
MRNLICWCPQTQRPIDLQLFTDYVTLARIWSSSVRFHCPHCGADHETKVGAAWLQTTLARTASSQTQEASELEENTEVHPRSTERAASLGAELQPPDPNVGSTAVGSPAAMPGEKLFQRVWPPMMIGVMFVLEVVWIVYLVHLSTAFVRFAFLRP